MLRVFVGATADDADVDHALLLETNLDDVPGEWIGHCSVRLFEAGAWDVYTTPIGMKKNRPGVQLSVLCGEADGGTMDRILFQDTATLGIRRQRVQRSKLKRYQHRVTTSFGEIKGKVGIGPDRVAMFAPEYEDCQRIARAHGVSLREVYLAAIRAYEPDPIPTERL